MNKAVFIVSIFLFSAVQVFAQETRRLSGTILTQQFEVVPNVRIEIETGDGKLNAASDAGGNFSLTVPDESLLMRLSGGGIVAQTRLFSATETLENLQIKVAYLIAPVNETVVIEDNTLTPEVETRNDTVYKNTLFARDDQLIQTLNAGINAGQHEGGGKSLEIRRFGYNLDHGGVSGGLKILVDNVQQNQGTQGHGQGYLGSLKSLSPELVEDVSILNGPFSAAYGDFSGLGVVRIRQKETLPQQLTLRLQGGSFDTKRAFLAYSPKLENADAFAAYESSSTDGPFANKLRYRRHNFTGNYTRKFSDREALGAKFNAGGNDFFSSGQIPLDEVFAGRLDRFGFIDPDNGGAIKSGTLGVYYRRELKSGAMFKADAFLGRSLFDLYSNFTFFLNDPLYGDEIVQHDSRFQQGANVQFLQPYKLAGGQSLVTFGGNFHASQINVGLAPSIGRAPNRKFQPENQVYRDANGDGNDDVLLTSARAHVNNYAAYVQNGADFFNGHLHVEAGLRLDAFAFDVRGFESLDENNQTRIIGGRETATALQPKLSVVFSPFERFPTTFYFNYGRGISSQDARGIVKNPDSPRLSATDFYQGGASYNARRFSATGRFFLINRSNEQIYIPDDGSIEFAGRTRSYGLEAKTAVRLNRYFSLNAHLTQVLDAFFLDEFYTDANETRRRVIVDSAPHTVASGSLVLTEYKGFNASLNWRHIGNYRLDGEDSAIRAAGHDVVDFAASKRLKRWIDVNFAIDNLLNKRYFETQNYFESRVCPTCEPIERIHATPGYPLAVSIGLTLRLFAKN